MSNGRIDEAQVDALLVNVDVKDRPLWRFALTTISETYNGLNDLRDVCEQRSTVCPGLALADPVAEREQEQHERQHWALWGVTRALLERVALPIVVVLLTLGLTRLFG